MTLLRRVNKWALEIRKAIEMFLTGDEMHRSALGKAPSGSSAENRVVVGQGWRQKRLWFSPGKR